MKLEFMFDRKYRVLDVGKMNCFFGGNNSNKTVLCETLVNGFSGKLSDFKFDGFTPNKTNYSVMYIDNNFNFIDEIRLKSRSNVMKYVKREHVELREDFYCDFISEVNELLRTDSKAINDLVSELKEDVLLSDFTFRTGIKDFNALLPFILELYFEEESKSVFYEFVLKFIIRTRDYAKLNIIIIDDFDRFFDDRMIKDFIHYCEKYENIIFFFTSRNYASFKYLQEHCVFNKELKKYDIKPLLKHCVLEREYRKNDNRITFEHFVDENIHLMEESDYQHICNQIRIYNDIIGNMFCNNYSLDEIIDMYEMKDEILQMFLSRLDIMYGEK